MKIVQANAKKKLCLKDIEEFVETGIIVFIIDPILVKLYMKKKGATKKHKKLRKQRSKRRNYNKNVSIDHFSKDMANILKRVDAIEKEKSIHFH